MRRFLIGATASAIMYGAIVLPAFAVNQAGAPANQIGTAVAGIAQSSDPNFGQAVCKPAGTTQTEDDGTLGFLGLTPPGNTP
ncbi:hypothetical protein HY357_03390 [Candidatus Roizmanbacteria bacterium]|nr:hypothetical protein [Candidatus Roizmanbacteria bacterium]